MDAKAIAARCKETTQTARDALGWIGDPRNAKKVSQELAPMEQKLRRVVNEASRLERSATRPTCVGVFGPSQAGKSYLISILARKGNAPLIATFDGARPEIDFIEDINPMGGKESTGVVTRFTIHGRQAPSGYPVCLRLLSQTDVIKILANSYFQDGNQEYEVPAEAAKLEELVVASEGRAKSQPVDTFSETDVWDLQEYTQKNSGGAATAAAIEPFWTRLATVAPRLELADRAKLLSILWGQHETYTEIYLRLMSALASLDFEQEAFVATEALVPSSESVINVDTLAGIHDDSAPRLKISTAAGTVAELTRPIITALIAELRIVCREQPLPFFQHTDLLDFPGYRTRFKTDLTRYFKDAADTASKEVFLRGKVDYLFQRYTSELELTTMVLCIPESVMEVASLPKAIETWVGMTHGIGPEKRLNKPTLLFLALTRFDRTLEVKAGDRKEMFPELLQSRFTASMTPFAKVEPSWVRQWCPGQPFRNVFLIRNPTVQFRGVVEYDGKREIAIVENELERLADLRAAFVALPTAVEHFSDPGGAWDALMTLNDGGAGRLAQALSQVCVADLKLRQIDARLAEIRRDVVETLARYHISDDVVKRREERLAFVDDVLFADLNECASMGRFGSALRGMMIDASDLYAALVEALNRPDGKGREEAAKPQRPAGPFGGPKKSAFPPPPTADRWEKLTEAALSAWATFLHVRTEDPFYGRRVGIGGTSLREMVAEIGRAATRLELGKRIVAELRTRSAPGETNEAIARKASLVAGHLINRFVSELDFDRIDPATQVQRFRDDLEEPVFAARPIAFDSSGIGAEQPDFTNNFMKQWGMAFRTTVSQNALANTGTLEDVTQNARLGKILQSLAV